MIRLDRSAAARRVAALLCVCAWALSGTARAAPAAPPATRPAPRGDELPRLPPPQRLVLNSFNLFRWNPIGLESQNRLGWQQRLYDSAHRATRDNFWFAGTYLRFSPAAVRAAAMVELQPASVFNLRLVADRLYYFGNFTFLQSRRSATDDLSDAAMQANRVGPLGNYAGGGQHLGIEPLIQAALGPWVLRNKTSLGWYAMDLQRGDQVWYEPTLDVPVPRRGWVVANDADLLYRHRFARSTLTLGLRHSWVRPLYTDREVRAGEDVAQAGAAKDHQRLGLLAAWTLYDTVDGRFDKPTLVLVASRYLDHAHRTGTGPNAVDAGVPYLVLGFAFQSDLLKR